MTANLQLKICFRTISIMISITMKTQDIELQES